MSNVYVIADLHLGHEKVALARGFNSTNQHNNAIIDNWNSVVGKRDSVFVLGDVLFNQEYFHLLGMLQGTKKLVMGNHDKYHISKYLPYFSQVFGCVKYKDCILTHVPVHESQFERFKCNIHGHLHGEVVTQRQDITISGTRLGQFDGTWKAHVPDNRYKCVSAEQINLTPVLFSSLIGE